MFRNGVFNLVASAASLVVFLTGMAAFAQSPTSPYGQPSRPSTGVSGLERQACAILAIAPLPQEVMDRIAPAIQINEEQQLKVKELLKAYQMKVQSITSRNQAGRTLLGELSADPTDPDRVQRAISNALKVEEAVLQAEVEYWAGLEKILSPEQSTAFWNMYINRQIPPPAPLPELAPPAGAVPNRPSNRPR